MCNLHLGSQGHPIADGTIVVVIVEHRLKLGLGLRSNIIRQLQPMTKKKEKVQPPNSGVGPGRDCPPLPVRDDSSVTQQSSRPNAIFI